LTGRPPAPRTYDSTAFGLRRGQGQGREVAIRPHRGCAAAPAGSSCQTAGWGPRTRAHWAGHRKRPTACRRNDHRAPTHVHGVEQAALVVVDAAPPKVSALHARLEGRRVPQRQGVHRLHVVVAVQQQGGRAAGAGVGGAGAGGRRGQRRVHDRVGALGGQHGHVLRGGWGGARLGVDQDGLAG
jgi:hypothetical protein